MSIVPDYSTVEINATLTKPYREGWHSYMRGRGPLAPYPDQSPEIEDWLEGWNEAQAMCDYFERFLDMFDSEPTDTCVMIGAKPVTDHE